jgi:hypothetical protein
MPSTELIRDIPIAWSYIREARRLVQEALSERDAELRDAAGMTISELIENAMKYGESVPAMSGARFRLTVDDGSIEIEVQNGAAADDSLARLTATIEAIAAATDRDAREALYIARLQEMLEDPSSGGRLGLYRIGYEGGFDLGVKCQDQVVTVTARRAV